MPNQELDLRDCATAYDARDRLPDLASWMSDEALKQLPIWKRARLEANHLYFDLTNPERGVFVATGDEQPVHYAFVRRDDVPEQVWAQLATWKQMVSDNQAAAIDENVAALGVGREQSGAGPAKPLPPA